MPDVALVKKKEKILKYVEKYEKNRHVVVDMCFKEWREKYFKGYMKGNRST